MVLAIQIYQDNYLQKSNDIVAKLEGKVYVAKQKASEAASKLEDKLDNAKQKVKGALNDLRNEYPIDAKSAAVGALSATAAALTTQIVYLKSTSAVAAETTTPAAAASELLSVKNLLFDESINYSSPIDETLQNEILNPSVKNVSIVEHDEIVYRESESNKFESSKIGDELMLNVTASTSLIEALDRLMTKGENTMSILVEAL